MPTKDKGKKGKKKEGKIESTQTAEDEGDCSTSQAQVELQNTLRENANNENIDEYLPNYQAEWFSMVIKNQVKRHIPEYLRQQQLDLEKVIEEKYESMQQQNNALRKEIEEALNKELAALKKRLEEVEEDNSKKQRRLERLEYTISQKDAKINELKTTIDQLEQKHYMREVQIVGIPESINEEDDMKKVLNLAKTKMGQKLKKSDVEHIHRLGKKSEKKTRDVIVKFNEKTVRDAFYQNRKKLIMKNDSRNSIYVNDHLTCYRKGLLYSARQLCKAKKISAAWSQHGNVHVRRSENDSVKQINSHDDLSVYNRTFTNSSYDDDNLPTRESTDDSGDMLSHLSDFSY